MLTSHVYRYDPLGRRDRHTDTAGSLGTQYQQYSYDPLSRLNQVQACDSAFASCTADEATSYDPLDNRATRTVAGANLSHSVDAANQLQAVNDGTTPKAAFVFDSNGNLTQKCEGTSVTGTTTSCTGSIVTTLTWNPLDQLIAVSKTGVPSETYQYDPQGRRISKTVGAVTTHYRYTGDDIDAEYSQTWNQTARYVHGAGVDDPLMRLTGSTSTPDAAARYYHQNGINSVVALSGNSQTRINAVTEAGASFTEGAGGGYTVGGVASNVNSLKDGNRSAASGHWTVTSGRTLDINFAGTREIEEVVLIGNPGLTNNPQPTETDLYGTASQFDNSTYTVQSWNGSAWVTQATASGNTNVIRRFTFTPVSTSKLRIIAVDDASNGRTVNDNVVSLAEVEVYTTPAGGTNQLQRFDAWGNKTQSAGAVIPQYGYTGREPDATGFIYYRARYYDPSIGRFISRDPAGMPNGVNRYAYVGNDPVNLVDPMGLWSFSLEAYAGIGGGISMSYDKGTFEMVGRLGVGIGGGLQFEPQGGPSRHAQSQGSDYIARTFTSVSAEVGAGPYGVGGSGTIRSGNAVTTKVGGGYVEKSTSTLSASPEVTKPYFGLRLGATYGVEIGSYSNRVVTSCSGAPTPQPRLH